MCFSIDELGADSIIADSSVLVLGYTLVLVFVCLILGRFNMVEHRVSYLFLYACPKQSPSTS